MSLFVQINSLSGEEGKDVKHKGLYFFLYELLHYEPLITVTEFILYVNLN